MGETGHELGSRKPNGVRLLLPVLSEQITLTLPSVSTEGSFLTIALRFDIRRTPSARVTVTTIGRPSGIAATARDTVRKREIARGVSYRRADWRRERAALPPIVNMSNQLLCWNTPIRQIIPITPNEIADNRFANSSIETCRGVFFSST